MKFFGLCIRHIACQKDGNKAIEPVENSTTGHY